MTKIDLEKASINIICDKAIKECKNKLLQENGINCKIYTKNDLYVIVFDNMSYIKITIDCNLVKGSSQLLYKHILKEINKKSKL